MAHARTRRDLRNGTLTVVETVYHQQLGDQPLPVTTRFVRNLSSQEQPYVRKLTLGPEWVPLDTGWITEASYVIIANEGNGPITKNPTDEQIQEEANRLIDISFMGEDPHPCMTIPSGESLRMCPVDLTMIKIRCLVTARCRITVFPV
jgi:hypothetical protein